MMGIHPRISNPLLRSEVTLNYAEQCDINEMFRFIPEIRMGLAATKGWAFVNPPTINFPGLNKEDQQDFQAVVDSDYVEFRWDAYLWRKKYGLVPYYFESIKNSRWHRPVVPIWGTGWINQYFDYSTRRMVYLWYWADAENPQDHDELMRFRVWNRPTIDGDLDSDSVSALRDWKMTKLSGEAGERAAYHGSRMPVFLTHKPPKIKPGDERFTINFGEDEELEMDRDAHNRELEKGQMSRNALRAGIRQQRAMNRGFQITERSCVLNSEAFSEKEDREGDAALDRLVELDSHWDVARVAPPVLLINPLEYQKRMGQVAAALLDFPLGLAMEQGAQRSANVEGNIQVARDRMAEIITSMNHFLEEVILQGEELYFRQLLQDEVIKVGGVKLKKKRKALTRDEMHDLRRMVFKVTVEQEPPPLVTLDQLEKIKDWGIISPESLAKQVFRLLNLPLRDIKVTKLLLPAEIEKAKIDATREKTKLAAQKAASTAAAKPSSAKKAKTSSSSSPK